ncbi:caspase-3-like [Leuresthes tenuis]|uniref:caspase-3-like n=1 Tax=Leuresthes tenuis TaxID=355514 RepID=UPI003B50B2F8
MSAKGTVKRNKTAIQATLAADRKFILDKVYEKKLITQREYNNLKSINKENDEGHVTELVDKLMNKGEDACQTFLNLLQTDEDIRETYPGLRDIQLNDTTASRLPVQVSSPLSGSDLSEDNRKKGKPYVLESQPVGLCLIINNENFMDNTTRSGTEKDAQSLAEVFSWLGFRVLMCKDQTKDQMEQTLAGFASLSGLTQLQVPSMQEWSDNTFTAPQPGLKHSDAFICCILSHGIKGAVLGIDMKPLDIIQITRTFEGTEQSALTGKPKVFLIQACQGNKIQPGVLLTDLQTDDCGSTSIPVYADVLVAFSTVEDHVSFRHPTNGSWFVQSVCQQLKEHCPKGEDIRDILLHVNEDVSEKEASSSWPGAAKQMPKVEHTLRKKLVLLPRY